LANSLNSRKNIKRNSLDDLDEWKSEFIFLRNEFESIRHKQNPRFCCAEDCVFLHPIKYPTPIGKTSEEVMHEHS